ncbi:GIY-YIG nuclease family protein [Bifidobacterium sp. UMB1230]|uniref:GIY-YIG nuclease family protein n=1 Tax=Gardnerella pickettii TaxID=2914924 RepID=UPI0031FD4EF5|nr:GIY-YIG nuclease family protein [Bifidobacterium sp. UMB1230]
MNSSKNLNIFLMDGDVTGRIKCTMPGWSGLAYKIPRIYLDKCKDREQLKQSGVYFLFGKNNFDEDAVYIGQAGIRKNGEGVLFRVAEHLKDDFYFNEAVMFTTSGNSWVPTEISYLENKFTNLAIDTNRYKVQNGNDPNPGNATEEKEAELEIYVEQFKIMLGVLGYRIFVPLVKTPESVVEERDDELILGLSRKIKRSQRNIEAYCKRTNEGFVVLAGSQIEETDSGSIPDVIKELRERCKQNNEIKDGVLTRNYLFKSPSYAASFVLGMTTNGKVDWKTEDGTSLKMIEENA